MKQPLYFILVLLLFGSSVSFSAQTDKYRYADSLYAAKNFDAAKDCYTEMLLSFSPSLSSREEYNYIEACARVADIFSTQEELYSELYVCIVGIYFCEVWQDYSYYAYFCLHIGNVFYSMDDVERAEKFYKWGLEVARKHGDYKTEVKILYNLTGLYVIQKDIPRAWACYNEMMTCDLGKYYGGLHYNLRAYIYQGAGELDSALRYYRITDSIFSTSHKNYPQPVVNLNMADIYSIKGNKAATLHYMDKHRKRGGYKGGDSKITLKKVMEIYDRIHEHSKGLEYVYDAMFVFDTPSHTKSTSNATFLQKFIDNNAKFFHYKAEEISRQEEEINRRNSQIIFITIAFLVAVYLVVRLLLQKKKLKQSYSKLYERSRESLDYSARINELENRLTHQNAMSDKLDGLGASDSSETERYKGSSLTSELRQHLIEQIKEVMLDEKTFCAVDFSLDKLAKLVGSNSLYVSQVLNKDFNMSFPKFLNKHRMRVAEKHLTNVELYGKLTLQAIAESVGLRSYSQFIASFKEETGLSPSVYKKMYFSKKEEQEKSQD